MRHLTEIKVRGYHLDLYGHVNNARYLEFLEEARWNLLEATGTVEAFTGNGLGFSIVNVNINYRRPAYLGEVLEIESSLASMGNRSAKIHQAVRLKGEGTMIADADVTFVVVAGPEGKAQPLEGDLRRLIETLG